MASSFLPDPLKLLRDALTKLENDANALATGSLRSQKLVRSLHQAAAVSQGLQQVLDKAIGAHLRRANLPSRADVVELAQALERIEGKLERLLSAQAPDAPASRPARTRRPPGAAAPAPEPEARKRPPARKPAPPAKKRARAVRTKEG